MSDEKKHVVLDDRLIETMANAMFQGAIKGRRIEDYKMCIHFAYAAVVVAFCALNAAFETEDVPNIINDITTDIQSKREVHAEHKQ